MLKCRGQVLTSTQKVQYEITLKKLGYDESGQPIVIADALMYGDGRPIVHMIDMSLRLRGISKNTLEAFWLNRRGRRGLRGSADEIGNVLLNARDMTMTQETTFDPSCISSASSASSAVQYLQNPPVVNAEGIAFDDASITAYAAGRPSAAFGARYAIFDGEERLIARLPRDPYKFLNRIVSIEGCEQWVMAAGGTIISEYDVPADAWYFSADGQSGRSGPPLMPFCVLLEAALQPCGWLSGYVGSALSAPHDLKYRNLGGTATQHAPVTPDIGTLRTVVHMTSCSTSGGMVIQQFTFAMSDGRGEPVYSGSTMFGFFSKQALANQVGIREARLYQPTAAELARALAAPYPQGAPYPAPALQMLTRIDRFVPDGGPAGLGYLEGSLDVDPSAWYFQAHFYQDPVTPGSLGLESFLQLLRVWACEHWQGIVPGRLQANGIGLEHRWLYRGQVLPSDQRCTVQLVVTAVDEQRRIVWADGYLGVDGRVIYQMIGFSLCYA
jgi:3-hydroxymyristoyl/3-hydroxydecanoyl-(acyl carrier protein) dehydratase